MVEHFDECPLMRLLPSSLRYYAILIATFYASLKCFGIHYCDPQLKEQGMFKSLVIIANSFLALFG